MSKIVFLNGILLSNSTNCFVRFSFVLKEENSGNRISIQKSRNRRLRAIAQLSEPFGVLVICHEQGRGITENESLLFFTGKMNMFNDIQENL